jgi:hypothetical protein
MPRVALDIPETCSKLTLVGTRMPFGFDDRVTASWWVWAKESSGAFILGIAPHVECPPCQEKDVLTAGLSEHPKLLPSTVRAFYRISPLAPSVCNVRLCMSYELGQASLPKIAHAWALNTGLGVVDKLRTVYERKGADVDAELRSMVPPPPRVLAASQQVVADEARALVERGEVEYKQLEPTSPFVNLWACNVAVGRGEQR